MVGMDGNTPGGGRPVVVSFTEDEARQVIRAIEMVRFIDSHVVDNAKQYTQPKITEVLETRAFRQQILDKVYNEVEQQLEP